MSYDVLVVGGASAGLTAAMYASRQSLKTLVITKDIGGQALLTNAIENYPPFEHIGGFELMQKFEQQARNFGAEFAYEEVLSITHHEGGGFMIKTNNKDKEYSGYVLILAFGKTPRDLNVKGEKESNGRGVSYCAVCDGPFFKNKKVGIVGPGDPALEAALYLKELASQLYIIHSTDKPVGSEESIDLLQNKDNNHKISFISNSIVKSINGNSKVESLTLYNSKTKSESKLDVDGIFVEMGYVARTDIVKDLVKLNDNKEIIVDKHCGTSAKGIFAAGDVTDVPYKQAIISAGQGAVAALSAYNYIQRLKGKPAIKADWKSLANKNSKTG
ncbi:MAG: FAD-dependent oxidoreductase [Nitrososphaeraceae archaeon]|nr:FAD-dependent oxidoreductase [Nitrososphaeraceae archaeon]